MTGFIYERSAEQVAVDAVVLARVKRGIALLEEQYGEDYADYIDFDTLDLQFTDRCVLGQVYGGYDRGEERLGLTTQSSIEHGFWAEGDDKDDHWEELTRAWVKALA